MTRAARTPRAVAPLPALGCACANLRRAARAVTQLYEGSLREAGLKPTQFTLLLVLAQQGEMTQGALGDVLALDSTTLTRSLRPLKQEGWIAARPGADRREVRWALTPAGTRVVERTRPSWERVQRQLRSRIGEELWTRLLDDLALVAGAARSS
jgi:DNA-binding MarR family transcriptional regulator